MLMYVILYVIFSFYYYSFVSIVLTHKNDIFFMNNYKFSKVDSNINYILSDLSDEYLFSIAQILNKIETSSNHYISLMDLIIITIHFMKTDKFSIVYELFYIIYLIYLSNSYSNSVFYNIITDNCENYFLV